MYFDSITLDMYIHFRKIQELYLKFAFYLIFKGAYIQFAFYLIFKGAYIRVGLIFGGNFVLVIRRAYILGGLIFWGLIFGILRYIIFICHVLSQNKKVLTPLTSIPPPYYWVRNDQPYCFLVTKSKILVMGA